LFLLDEKNALRCRFRKLRTFLRRETHKILHDYHLQPAARTAAACHIAVLGRSGVCSKVIETLWLWLFECFVGRAKSRKARHEPAQHAVF
jgi:hypothetical protein